MINSLFRRFILSHSQFKMLHFSFPEFLAFLHYLVAKLLLNLYKVSLEFSTSPSFRLIIFFVYRSYSWRLYMMVHKGFNSFSKCSSRFFSKKLKHSSSCYPECNSFFCIIGGGIMSFLII